MTTMKPADQFLMILSKAKKIYTEVTGQDMDATSFSCPSSVKDLQASLELRNNQFDEFRAKKAKIFKVLNGICPPIELLNNLTAGGAAMVFPPSSLCFGAIMYMIDAARNVSTYYDAVVGLLGMLKDFLVRLSEYTQEDISAELREKLAEILAILFEIFARSTQIMRRGVPGRIRQMSKNFFLAHDKTLDEMVDRLDAMTEGEGRLVGAETLIEIKRTSRKVDDLFVTLDRVSIETQQLPELRNFLADLNEAKVSAYEDQNQHLLDKVKKILNPSVNPEDTRRSIDKTRVPGTGDWVRSEDPFKSWLNQEKKVNPILLILGNPGSGKTYVCGNIISFLEQHHPQGAQHASRTSICYFFFKDNHPSTRSFSQALNDLAYQISLNDPVYAKYLGSTLQSASEIGSLRSKWDRLFLDYFVKKENIDSKAYVILDGVDEAFEAELKPFLQHLIDLKDAALNTSRGLRIHIIMVGRLQIIDDIEETLEGPVPKIYVNRRKNNKDIVDYVRNRIKKSKVLRDVKKDLQDEIVETVAEKANGMFMWVVLMMQELSQKSRPSSIRQSLHQAPKGLHEMLQHVLEGFSSMLKGDDPDDLNTMLMWVTCAARPLYLGELEVILKLQSPNGDGVLSLEEKLRKRFASFFALTREDHLSTADLQAENPETELAGDEEGEVGLDGVEQETSFESSTKSTTVAFCHASIGEFFKEATSGKVGSGPEHHAIGVDIVEAKIGVLKDCLNVICKQDDQDQEAGEYSIFWHYVSELWHTHVKEAADILDKVDVAHRQEIGTLLVKILRRPAFLLIWPAAQSYTFFTTENLKPLKKWLECSELYKVLALADREWIEEIQANEAEIFRPFARLYAVVWLRARRFPPHECMLKIHTIINLLLGRTDRNIPGFPMKVPVQFIMEAAEWAEFEQTALWHRRLAECLLENGHYEKALEHFGEALVLDPTMWKVNDGIARTLAACGNYRKAIELEKVVDTIQTRLLFKDRELQPSDDEYVEPTCRVHTNDLIAKWYSELQDSKSAVKHYMKALEIDKQQYYIANECIKILHSEGKYEEIISLLKSLDENSDNQKHNNLNTMVSIYDGSQHPFFNCVLRASRETKQLPWLQDVYEKVVVATKKKLSLAKATPLMVCLATIYMSSGNQEEKLEPLFDDVLKFVSPGALENSFLHIYQEIMAQMYGSYCLQKVYSAGNDSEAARYVGRLERLCKTKSKATDDVSDVVTTSVFAVYLGLWHHLHGREKIAREYLKPRMKEALMILSDEDLSNDYIGYRSLAQVLVAAGEDECARAAFHALHPTEKLRGDSEDEIFETEDEKNDSDADNSLTSMAINGRKEDQEKNEENMKVGGDEKPPSEMDRSGNVDDAAVAAVRTTSSSQRAQSAMDLAREKYPEGKWLYPWICDGPCGRNFPLYINASMCRICLRDICDDCLKLVQDGHESVRLVCSKDHKWLHIDPPEKEVNEGEILVGNNVMKLEEFVRGLKEKWAL